MGFIDFGLDSCDLCDDSGDPACIFVALVWIVVVDLGLDSGDLLSVLLILVGILLIWLGFSGFWFGLF